jgi:hypothetical protein
MFPAVLLQVVIVLAVTGLLLWAVSQIPMVVIVLVCIWLIYLLIGFAGGMPTPVFRR